MTLTVEPFVHLKLENTYCDIKVVNTIALLPPSRSGVAKAVIEMLKTISILLHNAGIVKGNTILIKTLKRLLPGSSPLPLKMDQYFE